MGGRYCGWLPGGHYTWSATGRVKVAATRARGRGAVPRSWSCGNLRLSTLSLESICLWLSVWLCLVFRLPLAWRPCLPLCLLFLSGFLVLLSVLLSVQLSCLPFRAPLVFAFPIWLSCLDACLSVVLSFSLSYPSTRRRQACGKSRRANRAWMAAIYNVSPHSHTQAHALVDQVHKVG